MDNSFGTWDGLQILIWTNGGYVKYIGDSTATNTAGWLEPNGPIILNPGVGAPICYNPNQSAATITFRALFLKAAFFTNHI